MKKILFTKLLILFSLAFPKIFYADTLELGVNSAISPATYHYLKSGFSHAEKNSFKLILIKMNTPGGLVTSTKDILNLIGDSKIPVAIWITPEGASATSAGAIISSGAHLLVMSEGTNIGAATPITMSGDIDKDKDKGSDLRAKAVNDLVALVKSLAQTRGRNADEFALMIEKAASYSARDALQKNIIDGVANNYEEFFNILKSKKVHLLGKDLFVELKNQNVEKYEMDLGQKLLDIFAHPSMAYILFIIGAALIYLEMQAPGGFIAGGLGALALVMAGIGFQVLPLNFGALGLIVLAFILFILEVYVTSYGILALAGLASLLMGSLFLFRTDEAYLSISYNVIFSTVTAVALFLGVMTYIIVKDLKKNRKDGDIYSLVGKKGKIAEILEKDSNGFNYHIKINGEIWKATSQAEFTVGMDCQVADHPEGEKILTIVKIA